MGGFFLAQRTAVQQVEAEVEKLAAALGYALVDLKLAQRRDGAALSVTIDKPGGVTLADCEAMSKTLADVFGEQARPGIGTIDTIDVESPGLDRVLRSDRELRYFTGRRVDVTTYVPIGDRRRFTATLMGVDEDDVLLEVDQETLRVPRAQIAKLRLHIDFSDFS